MIQDSVLFKMQWNMENVISIKEFRNESQTSALNSP